MAILREAAMRHILVLALVAAAVGACASESQRQEASYYQPPLSDGASVRPTMVEGTLEQVRRRGGLPSVLYEPDTIDQFCVYVFSVDGRMVGDRADCTAAVPIAPGKHTIAVRLQGDRYTRGGRGTFRPATATLMFDVEEGHQYKISMDTLSSDAAYPRRVWVTDVTTQTSVTEARLVTPKMGPEGTPSWAGSSSTVGSDIRDVALEHDK